MAPIPMRPTGSGLLIPVRMNESPTHRCNYPGCDWVGYNDREQVQHVKRHVDADQAEIVEMTTPVIEKIMGEGADPERQRYLEEKYARLKKDIGPKAALNPKLY